MRVAIVSTMPVPTAATAAVPPAAATAAVPPAATATVPAATPTSVLRRRRGGDGCQSQCGHCRDEEFFHETLQSNIELPVRL
jgi:hypothetical protein